MNKSVGTWFKSGSPWVWLNAGAVAISVILVIGLLGLIARRGLGHFWPGQILVADYRLPGMESRKVAGEIADSEEIPARQAACRRSSRARRQGDNGQRSAESGNRMSAALISPGLLIYAGEPQLPGRHHGP